MTPQLIVFLDAAGIPHVEIPGTNGMRVKVELGEYWTTRNPEIMQALQNLAVEQSLKSKQLADAKRKVEEQRKLEDAAREAKSNEDIAREKMADWQRRYDAATPEVREGMEKQRDRIIEGNRNRAKDIWMGLATDHDIVLANRAIDKTRRPKRRIGLANGNTYNPSTEKTFDKNGKEINKRRDMFKGSANGKVVKITL